MRATRGYALIIVLLVLALIALGFSTVLYVIASNMTETRRVLGETRAFYACDSARRIAAEAVQSVIVANPGADAATLRAAARDAVCQAAGNGSGCALPVGLMPPGAQLDSFSVDVNPNRGFEPIQGGALTGVISRQSALTLSIFGRDIGTQRTCKAWESLSVGTVTPFQLMAFSASDGTTRWYSRSKRFGSVPAYSNGNFCLSGSTPGDAQLYLTRVGSANGLATPTSGAGWCTAPAAGSANVNLGSFSAGTMAAWGGGFHLNAHPNSPLLKLPIATPPLMGGDNNADSARWILDPVFPTEDTSAVQQLKLANLADIRIIDGVWYFNDGSAFPGLPIYSDHPGRNIAPGAEEAKIVGAGARVGIGDILTNARSYLGLAAPGPTEFPLAYSYYETKLDNGGGSEKEGEMLPEAFPTGVISYGVLERYAPSRWRPGTWSCGGSAVTATVTSGVDIGGASPVVASCADGKAAILDGTRSGFTDVSLRDAGAGNGQILPINFDIAAFRAALANTADGELGAYFRQRITNGGGPFNGIVYITSTWRDMFGGMDTGAVEPASPARWPDQGGANQNPSQSLTTGAGIQLPATTGPAPAAAPWDGSVAREAWSYPYPLCAGMADNGSSKLSNGSDVLFAGFPLTGCAPSLDSPGAAETWGGDGTIGPRPNAVRIFHGEMLGAFADDHGTATPPNPHEAMTLEGEGLTIATNLPLYVMGDFNMGRWSTSATTGLPMYARVLLAADRITVLSSAWDDRYAPWGDRDGDGDADVDDVDPVNYPAMARQTCVRAALMTGWTPQATRGSEDLEQLVRVIERWPAGLATRCSAGTPWATDPTSNPMTGPFPVANPLAALRFDGAVYGAFSALYATTPQVVSSAAPTLPAASFEWRYDFALANALFQPPGAPRYVTGVQNKWIDTR